jgi:dTDP-4-dehydrorhamnose reductase
VFDGASPRPYREDDPTQPIGAYGRSKLEGEKQVSARCANSAILRTSWIYSPFGTNFVKTMLRLGEAREEVGVVADQIGNPTSALDLADALVAIAKRLVADPARKFRGVFNISGAGEATWADFAEVVFGEVEKRGRRPVHVKRIATADYPTLTQRPANSCLDNSKLRRVYGLTLPPWRNSVVACVARLMQTQDANQKD